MTFTYCHLGSIFYSKAHFFLNCFVFTPATVTLSWWEQGGQRSMKGKGHFMDAPIGHVDEPGDTHLGHGSPEVFEGECGKAPKIPAVIFIPVSDVLVRYEGEIVARFGLPAACFA